MSETIGRPCWYRPTAFRVGVLSGILALAVGSGVIYGVLHRYEAPEFNVEVVSSGTLMTLRDARQLVISHQRGAVTQSCNEACDDLWYRAKDDENTYSVKVLDADGDCLVCDAPRDIMGGYGAWSVRWDVGRGRALDIVVTDQVAGAPWRPVGVARAK